MCAREDKTLNIFYFFQVLERNMSLSGQYLEELSRRYKKQVEEMQRSLERAVSAMNEESRRGDERDAKRMKEIITLKQEIALLSKSVESFLRDRDSWRSRISVIGQHTLLISLEVVVVILVLSYCRKTNSFEEEQRRQSVVKKESTSQKSAENFNSHAMAKKTKKRRPSDLTSYVSGQYQELMLDDRYNETKKERKKKRKKETAGARMIMNADVKREAIRYKSVLNIVPGGTTLPSQKASLVDSASLKEFQNPTNKKTEYMPETSIGWSNDQQTERIERISQFMPEDKTYGKKLKRNFDHGRQVDELSESNSLSESSANMDRSIEGSSIISTLRNGSFKTGNILKVAKLTSPSFMKTALGTRSKRKSSSNSEKWNWNQDSENSNDRSVPSSPTGPKVLSLRTVDSANGNAATGSIEESDESRSNSSTSMLGKKEKKSTGLRKMVRKFF